MNEKTLGRKTFAEAGNSVKGELMSCRIDTAFNSDAQAAFKGLEKKIAVHIEGIKAGDKEAVSKALLVVNDELNNMEVTAKISGLLGEPYHYVLETMEEIKRNIEQAVKTHEL